MSNKHCQDLLTLMTFDISESIFHKKGFTLYKVTFKEFPRNSIEVLREVTVWKRYNDFKKLYKALSTIHQNLYLKGSFPPFAKTRIFGRFDPEVIEERKKSALELLAFAAKFPALFTSQVFEKFFEEGYIFEEAPKTPVFSEPSIFDSKHILKPLKSNFLPDIPEPKLSNRSADRQTRVQESIEPVTPLGGIWQHHQVPDNISLGSYTTDDDDRTTFTDEDSLISRPSLNLSEFDPLYLPENTTQTQDSLCNSWLLTALQSCSVSSDVEKDTENILEFPKPFEEYEGLDDSPVTCTDSSCKNESTPECKETHFPFDIPISPTQEHADIVSEFDPLKEQNTIEDQEDSYMYDSFAMTPNSDEKESSNQPLYVSMASQYVRFAQEAEVDEKYQEAFDLFKKAIDVLLQGFQKDKCSELKEFVRKRVLLYLMKAEELYENKLPKLQEEKYKTISSISQMSNVKIGSSLQGSVNELEKFKVLGVMDKVLLVLDISTDDTFIVKTVYKSSKPSMTRTASIIPQNIPFMIKLLKVYETNYAFFLILEHATGGRLWDYVSSFLERSKLSPDDEGSCPTTIPGSTNAYTGKKMVDQGDGRTTDPDLTPSENCPQSYVTLFKKYADSMDKKELVSIAKYHRLRAGKDQSMVSSSEDINKKMNCLLNPKSITNRLSSSTGSLETTYTTKTSSNMDALEAMDKTTLKSTSATHLPDVCIKLWAAEIVLALDCLHNLGIIWMDFNPDNILLGAEGHILLTYKSQWDTVNFILKEPAKINLFCAPEVGSIFPVTSDCDWWSLGAILFELITGQTLFSCHPTGITPHTILYFPTNINSDAKDFISKLLQFSPGERLGSGIYGIEEIKSHPFFRNIDWRCLVS